MNPETQRKTTIKLDVQLNSQFNGQHADKIHAKLVALQAQIMEAVSVDSVYMVKSGVGMDEDGFTIKMEINE